MHAASYLAENYLKMENGMSCYYECMRTLRYKNNIKQQVVNKSRHTTCVAERKPKQDIIFQIIPQISSEIPFLSNKYTQKEPIVKVTSI